MIPIFIISCDRLEVLKKSIQSYNDCIKTPFEIVIIDFGSTYEPTLEYLKGLEHEKVKVYWKEKIRHKGNLNNISEIVQDYFKDHSASNYVVTDPDIALDNVEGNILNVYTHLLEILPENYIAGPMLRIDDIPDYYPRKKEVINWEMRHNPPRLKINTIQYENRIVKYIFAHIDTTFSMNRAGTSWRRYVMAARVMPPYSARHLDWYLNPQCLSGDQEYYMKHASRRISNWSFLD